MDKDLRKDFQSTAGQKLIDIVEAGVAEWYEVTSQDALKQMMPRVKSGEVAEWDETLLNDFGVDIEWVEEEWAKLTYWVVNSARINSARYEEIPVFLSVTGK